MLEDERAELIIQRFAEGESGADIGRELGISRETVRNIRNKVDPDRTRSVSRFITASQIAEKLGYSKDRVLYFISQGKIKAFKTGLGYLAEPDVKLEKICVICGGFVPKGQQIYCKDECTAIGRKRKTWARLTGPKEVDDVTQA